MGLITKTQAGVGFLRERVHSVPLTISSTALDSGHTSYTYVLRPGLVLGKITATGELAHYAPGAADGTETAYGILLNEVDLKGGDPNASSADKIGDVLLIGTVDSSKCILWDAAAAVDFGTRIIGL